jgi:hypothetical protein
MAIAAVVARAAGLAEALARVGGLVADEPVDVADEPPA